MSRNSAPRAPSTTRWSNETLSSRTGRTAGCPSTATIRSAIRPTARIAACGALTIASNESTPYMPRFEIVNVPPETSSGRSRPSRAAATSSCRRAAICASSSRSASWMTGTTSAVVGRDGDRDVDRVAGDDRRRRASSSSRADGGAAPRPRASPAGRCGDRAAARSRADVAAPALEAATRRRRGAGRSAAPSASSPSSARPSPARPSRPARGRRRGAARRRRRRSRRPGREPASAARSMPCSAASRRAFGEASVRRGRPLSRHGAPARRSQEPERPPAPTARRARSGAVSPCREHERDRLADGNLVALGRAHRGERPGGGRLELDGDLVRLDLEQRLALGDGSPSAFSQRRTLPGLLRHAERGHDHLGRHQSTCAPSPRADCDDRVGERRVVEMRLRLADRRAGSRPRSRADCR